MQHVELFLVGQSTYSAIIYSFIQEVCTQGVPFVHQELTILPWWMRFISALGKFLIHSKSEEVISVYLDT